MKFFSALIFITSVSAFADGDYKRLTDTCKSCNAIDNLIIKHNTEMSSTARLELALQIAGLIDKISVKGKPELEKRREMYFAINATTLVLSDDFDSETVSSLMDLRAKSPKDFDYVFWRFPTHQQSEIVNRMKAFKEDKLKPKAQIPQVKKVED